MIDIFIIEDMEEAFFLSDESFLRTDRVACRLIIF